MFVKRYVLIVVGALALLVACAGDIPAGIINTDCTEGVIREGPACGINGRGYQPQKCVRSVWRNVSDCVDPDRCTDGDLWVLPAECGLNGKGSFSRRCVAGQWVESDRCVDPDVCVNGDTRKVVCGYNDGGEQPQKCVEGQWADDGACIDPGACKNGTLQTKAGDVSECVSGQWVLRRSTKQWGTGLEEHGTSVAVDRNGDIFVTGYTRGSLDGNENAGGTCTDWPTMRVWPCSDIFLTKWNSDGTKAWTRQWGTGGTESDDMGNSVAVDGDGGIFVAGLTFGSLDGNTNQSGDCDPTDAVHPCPDIFLTKWRSDGTKVWTKQWGTEGYDAARSVAVGAGGAVFVAGHTWGSLDGNDNAGGGCTYFTADLPYPCPDAFLTKWNADGTKAWTRQWGTSGSADEANSLALDDSGNIFVTGFTTGAFDGNTPGGCLSRGASNCYDIFLTKWNADGTPAWTRQWGNDNYNIANAVVVDRTTSNLFVAGSTSWSLDGVTNVGGEDLLDTFLTKFDADGTEVSTAQWGTENYDQTYAAAVDGKGNVFVTGYDNMAFQYNPNNGGNHPGCSDVILSKWTPDNTRLWTKQWGTVIHDYGSSVAVGADGKVFVAGSTSGSLDGNSFNGGFDVFLTIFPPEKESEADE